MTVRAEKAGTPKHTRASLEVEKARIEREEAERQLIAAKKTFKGKLNSNFSKFRNIQSSAGLTNIFRPLFFPKKFW